MRDDSNFSGAQIGAAAAQCRQAQLWGLPAGFTAQNCGLSRKGVTLRCSEEEEAVIASRIV